jgi:hypothetical protein
MVRILFALDEQPGSMPGADVVLALAGCDRHREVEAPSLHGRVIRVPIQDLLARMSQERKKDDK